MSIYNYKEEVELKTNILKRLQYDNDIFIDTDLINENWLKFQEKIEENYKLENEIYKVYAKIFKGEVYKDENIIFKSKNIAVSKDVIYVTNPKFISNIKTFLEKGYKLGFIKRSFLNQINIEKNSKIRRIEKMKKNASNLALKSINDGFSKVEVLLSNDEVIVSKYKNNKKVIDKFFIENIDIHADNYENFFKGLQKVMEPNLEKDFKVKFSISHNKMVVKSEPLNFDYLNLLMSNNDKQVMEELNIATSKSKGLIFVGGKRGMGKTSFLKGLKSHIEQTEYNREIKYIDKDDALSGEIYADIVFVDVDNPISKLDFLIDLSLSGALVLVSINSQNSLHTLKMIKYKNSIDKNLFSDELIGIYHQAILPEAIMEATSEESAFDLREYKAMLNYANRPNPNDKILTEKEIKNIIPEVHVVCEWLETSDVIKNAISENFDEKEIMIDQRTKEWEDMSEKALILLKNKKITINDFTKNLNLF